MDRDRILTTDNNEANDEFGPTFNSLLNASKSNFFDTFSNAVDDGIGCDSKNDNNESMEKSSGSLVDTRDRTSANENDVSAISYAENEVIENGDDSSVAEKNPTVDTNAGFLLEPNDVMDNVSKKENVCGNHNGDTSLINDEILDSDHRNNFGPSIVKICGGRSDVLEQADQSSSTSLHHDVSSFTAPEDNTCISDITMKQSANNVLDNDCVHTGTENCRTSFSIELLNNEEKTVNTEVGDSVVICNETTSKLSSSIPTENESSIEAVSQPSVSQTEKCFVKKRFTRSSLSKLNDRTILSSSSSMDIGSDSKKRNQLPKNAPNSSSDYSCQLCNVVFQGHELLNKHMIQHHNNYVTEKKTQNRSKTKKLKLYSCDICKKELSTSQSLQQHVLIHKNVKPFGCHICRKDFRHLSNYRMHLQKHKAEQRHRDKMQQTDKQENFDKRGVHSVNFGRPVCPLFMKESLLHPELNTVNSTSRSLRNTTRSSTNLTKKRTSKPFHSTKESPSRQPPLSFDQHPLKIKENITSSISPAVIIRRQVLSPNSICEQEYVAVKSFENIESIVLNTSKIIVKLDNLDTSILKRKLLTPDISIDQPPKKFRARLSPIAEKYNIKLDEIENIPMDADSREIDLPFVEQIEDDQLENYLDENNDAEITGDSVYPPHDTLSDNELFSLLNDDRDTSTAITISVDSTGDGNGRGSVQILQPEHSRVDTAKTAILPDIKQSNVIFVDTPLSYEMSCYEDETASDDKLDAFDIAFEKVATRRLALLQKRAAENGGKVESHFLLGPLFWCKALRRAQKSISVVAAGSSNNGSHIGDSPKTWADLKQFEGCSMFDDQQTNDPTQLQSRAESKFKCLLNRAKRVKNLNALNLAGPLFWRRTLQLAGVHRGEDLRTHMNVALPSLEGVEFVGDDGTPCDFGTKLVSAELQKMSQPSTLDLVLASGTSTTKSNYQQSNDQLLRDRMSPVIASDVREDDVLKLSDQILSSVALAEQQTPINDDAAPKNALDDVLSVKTDNILFESLTKPKENQRQLVEPDNLPPSDVHCGDVFIANPDNTVISSFCRNFQIEMSENYSTNMLNNKYNELTGDAGVAIEDNYMPSSKLDTNYSGSIVLNADCDKSLQLIPVINDQVAIPEAGQNFMLVSDGSGTMQYLVNVTNENLANFELIGDSGCGDQVTYAIQFDGENYTAVQLVHDEDGIQLQNDGGSKEALLVDSTAATHLISNAGVAVTTVVADPKHIDKELSDFLNLDYVNFLKNGTAD